MQFFDLCFLDFFFFFKCQEPLFYQHILITRFYKNVKFIILFHQRVWFFLPYQKCHWTLLAVILNEMQRHQSNFHLDSCTHVQKELPDVFSVPSSNLQCFQYIQLKTQRTLLPSVLTFYFPKDFSPTCSAASQLDIALDDSLVI